MALADILKVRIDPNYGNKFIVAKVTDGNGEERLVVRADMSCKYHKDILEKLQQEVRLVGLFAHCIGGGQIYVNQEQKTILIWGRTSDFGMEPNRKETAIMLQAAFPGFTITVCKPYN